jgi:hypothetical protein
MDLHRDRPILPLPFVRSARPIEINLRCAIVESACPRVDLLFFHLKLRCFVVIEVLTRPFKPSLPAEQHASAAQTPVAPLFAGLSNYQCLGPVRFLLFHILCPVQTEPSASS